MKTITLRFPKPLPKYDAQGKEKPSPYFDWDGMFSAIAASLEPQLQDRFGDDVELVLELANASDIRVSGSYLGMKTTEVRDLVSEMLGEVMEGIDTSEYANL